jgi:V/A-type H+-transporting ATPase subunit K
MGRRNVLLGLAVALLVGVASAGVALAMEGAAPAAGGSSGGLGNAILGIGAGLAIGLAGIGTGLAQSRIGAAGAGAITEKPEIMGMVIILLAIPETVVILGFVVAAMIMTMLKG